MKSIIVLIFLMLFSNSPDPLFMWDGGDQMVSIQFHAEESFGGWYKGRFIIAERIDGAWETGKFHRFLWQWYDGTVYIYYRTVDGENAEIQFNLVKWQLSSKAGHQFVRIQ